MGDWTSGEADRLRLPRFARDRAWIESDSSVYYGKPDGHAYFVGCSDGGREALMEAERYPEDFDGILAGAPANHWTHHFTGFLWNEQALNAKPESKIPPAKLPAIQKAALAQCDALDGVKDGLLEDPRACHFDPSVLLSTAWIMRNA